MKNSIWRLHFGTVRCHTENTRLKTHLLSLSGAKVMSTYHRLRDNRLIGWDVDVSVDRLSAAERILGVSCDHSTTCTAVRTSTECGESLPKLVQKRHLRLQEGQVGRETGNDRSEAMSVSESPQTEDTLPVRFRECGTIYEQVERSGPVAIYSQRYSEDGDIIGYDVVVIQKTKTGERYPSGEQWGKWAWSFDTLDSAREKYNEMVEVYPGEIAA